MSTDQIFYQIVLHRDHPHIMGLITNDTCNLSCAGCRVANVTHEVMSIAEVRDALQRYYDKGVRMLYLSGGEPYLWRDGEYRLPDIVGLAHDIGYLRVHVYTNGTVPLSPKPDFTWVSIDGFGRTFEKIRGIPVERVLANVREFHGRHAIVCTINTINYREIPETLEFFGEHLPRAAVMFFFHTPYYGIDHLHISPAQREHAVTTILDCKRRGFPVLNSKTALETYRSGGTTPRLDYSWIVDSFTCSSPSG